MDILAQYLHVDGTSKSYPCGLRCKIVVHDKWSQPYQQVWVGNQNGLARVASYLPVYGRKLSPNRGRPSINHHVLNHKQHQSSDEQSLRHQLNNDEDENHIETHTLSRRHHNPYNVDAVMLRVPCKLCSFEVMSHPPF